MELFAYGIERRLRGRMGPGLRLILTNNRRSLVSIRRCGDLTEVRLARLFLEADPETTEGLIAFITGDTQKLSLAAHRFAENYQLPQSVLRKAHKKLKTKGKSHDLAQLANEVDQRYFAGLLKAKVTWGRDGRGGRRAGRKRGRSIQLGSYNPDLDLITLHPALDTPHVPAEYVGLVLYHEMLHKKLGVGRGENGRRAIHSRAFRAAEKKYEGYAAMVAWEKKEFATVFFAPQKAPGRPKGCRTKT